MRLTSLLSTLICLGFSVHMAVANPVGFRIARPEVRAETVYHQGLASLAKGELEAAEAAFQESVRLNPSIVSAVLGLAEVALRKGDTRQVVAYLQKAQTMAPQSAEVYTAWGRHLYAQKQFQAAEAAFKKAIALAPRAVAPRVDLGDLYLQGFRRPEAAIATYRDTLALAPTHAGAHYALGLALSMGGNIEAAQTAFTEASRLQPDNPLPLHTLGQLHAARKDYDRALAAFAAALQAQPEFVQAHLSRGDIFLHRGEDEQALVEYTAALHVAPKLPLLQVRIGIIHERQKRLAEAEQAYLAAIDLDPQHAVAYNNLAWLVVKQQSRLDEALTWAQQAVALAPQVPHFQDTLGWVHRARGDHDQAALILRKAATAVPQQARIVYHLGVVYAEQGKTREAAIALKKALTLEQGFPEADDARQRLATLDKKVTG